MTDVFRGRERSVFSDLRKCRSGCSRSGVGAFQSRLQRSSGFGLVLRSFCLSEEGNRGGKPLLVTEVEVWYREWEGDVLSRF